MVEIMGAYLLTESVLSVVNLIFIRHCEVL